MSVPSSRGDVLDRLAAHILRIQCNHPVRVAIDGVDASGKTTLADELVAPLEGAGRPVVRSGIDAFHHPSARRHRGGAGAGESYYHDSFDYEGLREVLLDPLGPDGDRRYRRAIFDYRTDTRVDAPVETAPHDTILLFDGVFLQRPGLRSEWDLAIFVRARFEVTLARAERRDASYIGDAGAVRRRYRERYIPGQQLYLADSRPDERAALILDNDDPDRPVLHEVQPTSAAWRTS